MRGAWIEICSAVIAFDISSCRSPCGERGLKYIGVGNHTARTLRRSPCGERGLKLEYFTVEKLGVKSLPVRGAWIEIICWSMRLR